MSNPPAVSHPTISGSAVGLGSPSISDALKHPRTPTNPSLDYPSADSDQMSKRTRPTWIADEVNLPVNMLPVSFLGHSSHTQAFNAPDDLLKTVARTLNQGSSPKSMDFHPVQQTLLFVGTSVGDIGLWEVGSHEKLVLKNIKVWNLSALQVQCLFNCSSKRSSYLGEPCNLESGWFTVRSCIFKVHCTNIFIS
ncbi:putative Topless family protein [Helianthus debilis subsp. tardiflorus]